MGCCFLPQDDLHFPAVFNPASRAKAAKAPACPPRLCGGCHVADGNGKKRGATIYRNTAFLAVLDNMIGCRERRQNLARTA